MHYISVPIENKYMPKYSCFIGSLLENGVLGVCLSSYKHIKERQFLPQISGMGNIESTQKEKSLLPKRVAIHKR